MSAVLRQAQAHAQADPLPTPSLVPATEPETGPQAAGQARGSVRFEQVSKRYPGAASGRDALQGIDVHIEPGQIFGIIGRSGAGKSSLLRTINRLESVSSGRVLVDGEDISQFGERQLVALRRRIGMVFQHFNLLSAKTVWQNVALPLKVAGHPAAEIRQRVDELLALVGLSDKRDVYPSRLSGGQKQRVGIARALVHRPEILLCDEATSALDPESTQAILALLRDIHRQLGLTVVLITHEMAVIREICHQVLVLEQGQPVEQGPVWQVFGAPRHEATRALLAPLAHGLPVELQQRLHLKPPSAAHALTGAPPRFDRLIELSYTGETDLLPDWQRLATVLQGAPRLLHGGIEQLQGHAHGRLVLAIEGMGPGAQAVLKHQLSHQAKDLGYVERHL